MIPSIQFRHAVPEDAQVISTLVCALTQEITQATGAELVDDLASTTETCYQLMSEGHYAALLAVLNEQVVGVATFTQTYALYAGGKMGVVQEFYVAPEYRSLNVGSLLLTELKTYGKSQGWACIELCTPPLPQFERTLSFYQHNGLLPVGGRKMRENLT